MNLLSKIYKLITELDCVTQMMITVRLVTVYVYTLTGHEAKGLYYLTFH